MEENADSETGMGTVQVLVHQGVILVTRVERLLTTDLLSGVVGLALVVVLVDPVELLVLVLDSIWFPKFAFKNG
ncbi:unnamed protein product [Prunus brigantina]